MKTNLLLLGIALAVAGCSSYSEHKTSSTAPWREDAPAQGATGMADQSGSGKMSESGGGQHAKMENATDRAVSRRVRAALTGRLETMGYLEESPVDGLAQNYPDPVSTANHEWRYQTYPNLKVTTSGGVVTLHGTVSSEAEKELITQRVAAVAGVRSVRNELIVASPETTEPVSAEPDEGEPSHLD